MHGEEWDCLQIVRRVGKGTFGWEQAFLCVWFIQARMGALRQLAAATTEELSVWDAGMGSRPRLHVAHLPL